MSHEGNLSPHSQTLLELIVDGLHGRVVLVSFISNSREIETLALKRFDIGCILQYAHHIVNRALPFPFVDAHHRSGQLDTELCPTMEPIANLGSMRVPILADTVHANKNAVFRNRFLGDVGGRVWIGFPE